jgi:hypothetical protein
MQDEQDEARPLKDCVAVVTGASRGAGLRKADSEHTGGMHSSLGEPLPSVHQRA